MTVTCFPTYIYCQTLNGDIHQFFQHENHPVAACALTQSQIFCTAWTLMAVIIQPNQQC